MKKVIGMVAVAAGLLLATSCNNCKCSCQDGAQCDQKCGVQGEGPEEHHHKGQCPDGPRRPMGPRGPKEEFHRGHRHQMNPEMAEKIGKWMNFDSLSVEEQKALIAERKAEIDAREEERKAKKAEMEEKWANFDKLSIEEQKQLLDRKHHMPFHKGMHKGGPKGGHGGGPRAER